MLLLRMMLDRAPELGHLRGRASGYGEVEPGTGRAWTPKRRLQVRLMNPLDAEERAQAIARLSQKRGP